MSQLYSYTRIFDADEYDLRVVKSTGIHYGPNGAIITAVEQAIVNAVKEFCADNKMPEPEDFKIDLTWFRIDSVPGGDVSEMARIACEATDWRACEVQIQVTWVMP